jgi:hypothetical protein
MCFYIYKFKNYKFHILDSNKKIIFVFILNDYKKKNNKYFSKNVYIYLHLLNLLADFGLHNRFFYFKKKNV